jgi:RecA-family ATPase
MARRDFSNVEVAVRQGQKARIALSGLSGAGKTLTALQIAKTLTDGGNVLVADTENRTASLYSDELDGWTYNVFNWEPPFDPRELTKALVSWQDAYDAIILDSFSAFWSDQGGVLEIVSQSRGDWKEGTRIQNEMVKQILHTKCHLIACMRSKPGIEMERDEQTGKVKVTKLGLEPIQRNTTIYEFNDHNTIDLDNHSMKVEKTRFSALDKQVFYPETGTKKYAELMRDWLAGAEAREVNDRATDNVLSSLEAREMEVDAATTITPGQMEELTALFNAIKKSEDRTKAKAAFAKKWGNPANLLTSDYAAALADAEGLATNAAELISV